MSERVLRCKKDPSHPHEEFNFKAVVREFGLCDKHGNHTDTLETSDWEVFEYTCTKCDSIADFVTIEED